MSTSVGETGLAADVELEGGDANPSSGAPGEFPLATPADLLDQRRPNVTGDLRTMFQAAPMFRRALLGYSRFQVDTYVQWAEDELAAAARENDDVLARYAQVRSELDEAQQLLSHSPGGAEFLRASRRIGGRLARAADQAEVLVAEAQAHRDKAATEAEQVLADAAAQAQRVLAEAGARAEQVLAEAEEVRADADRLLAEAEQAAEDIRLVAQARLEEARAAAHRTVEEAERVRRVAAEDASAIRLQAQHDGVRLLARGREERLRSDAEAAALRARLEQEAAARRATLVADVEQLERRRALLEAVLANRPEPVAVSRRRRKGRRDAEQAVPAPRSASSSGEPERPALRGGAWRWHGRRVHL